MKKTIVAMFLYLLLIVSVASAEPIRFLNLEWGASLSDLCGALISEGLDGETPLYYNKEDSFTLASYETHDEISYRDTYTELYTMTATFSDHGNQIWEIGGQPVYKIIATFVPGTILKDDGITYYTRDHRYARLVRVEVELQSHEASSFGTTYIGFDSLYNVFNDLKAKLSTVYGDNYHRTYSGSGMTESLTWSSDNGWVELEKVDSKVSSGGITVQGVYTKLIYGFNDLTIISNIWKDYHKDDLKGL